MSRHAMSKADAAWLHMDRPTNLMVINTVLWFERPADWRQVRAIVEERVVSQFPRFRQRVVEDALGRPAWEDDPRFDPDLHFHRVALPPPGDQPALQALVADLMASPLDRAKPLWHFHMVDGYGEGSAIVCRFHHCMADGVTLARLMMTLMDGRPDSGGFETPALELEHRPRGGIRRVPVAGQLAGAVSGGLHLGGTLLHEGLETVVHPGRLVDAARAGTEAAEALAKLVAATPDPRTPLRQELGVPRQVAWSQPLPLEAVKAVGRAIDGTVNDALIATIAGALARYLRQRDALVDELHALVPFNLRPLDRPLPRELGNKFGLVIVALPVGLGDPVERLKAIKQQMDSVKHSKQGAVAYGLLAAVGAAPSPVESRVIDFFTARGTLVLTNVPGPTEPVYVAGAPVRGVLVWAPCAGSIGMTVALFSYRGEVTVGLMADRGLVPEPDAVVAAFGDELKELLAAVDSAQVDAYASFPWGSLRRGGE